MKRPTTSQIETLKAVRRYEAPDPNREIEPREGASPATVADAIGRKRPGVEASLDRLTELGYVEPVYHRLVSASYRLTGKGRDVLTGKGEER